MTLFWIAACLRIQNSIKNGLYEDINVNDISDFKEWKYLAKNITQILETDRDNVLQMALLRKRIFVEVANIVRLMKINRTQIFTNSITNIVDKLLQKNTTSIKSTKFEHL